MGRFISRDSIGYVDGYNLYSAYFAPNRLDPNGTCATVVIVGHTGEVDFTPGGLNLAQEGSCDRLYKISCNNQGYYAPEGSGPVNYGGHIPNAGSDEYGRAPRDNPGINRLINNPEAPVPPFNNRGNFDWGQQNTAVIRAAMEEAQRYTRTFSQSTKDCPCYCKKYCFIVLYIYTGADRRRGWPSTIDLGGEIGMPASNGPAERHYAQDNVGPQLAQDMANDDHNQDDILGNRVGIYMNCWDL